MQPNALLETMKSKGKPVTIRELAEDYFTKTGTFADKRIQHSMKMLERTGKVVSTVEPGNPAKLWSVVDADETSAPGPVDPDNPEGLNESALVES